MKKKARIIIIGVFVMTAAIITLGIFVMNNALKVREFSVEEYESEIEEFPYNAVFGEITERSDAVKAGDAVIAEQFPDIERRKYYPYSVYYDSNSDIWLVMGRAPLSPNIKRFTPHVLINGDDGSVIASFMW